MNSIRRVVLPLIFALACGSTYARNNQDESPDDNGRHPSNPSPNNPWNDPCFGVNAVKDECKKPPSISPTTPGGRPVPPDPRQCYQQCSSEMTGGGNLGGLSGLNGRIICALKCLGG
jgi:hypothetical protein